MRADLRPKLEEFTDRIKILSGASVTPSHLLGTSGTVTTIAGVDAAGYSGDAGPAAAATFDWPIAIAVDGVGNVYVATLRGVVRAIRAGC
jgi:hypothetical protein